MLLQTLRLVHTLQHQAAAQVRLAFPLLEAEPKTALAVPL